MSRFVPDESCGQDGFLATLNARSDGEGASVVSLH